MSLSDTIGMSLKPHEREAMARSTSGCRTSDLSPLCAMHTSQDLSAPGKPALHASWLIESERVLRGRYHRRTVDGYVNGIKVHFKAVPVAASVRFHPTHRSRRVLRGLATAAM